MRQALLISVAAVALAAGSNVALSQGGATGGGASGGAGGSINAPMANPSGPGGAGGGLSKDTQSTMENAPAQRGDRVAPAPGSKGAQDRAIPDKQRTTQQPPGQTQPQQRTTEQPAAGGARQGAAERPMTSKSVSLTTEQRTTIRRTVLTGSAPRVTNVNFDIRVGVVVPRTVRVAPLPVSLIEIEPEWRGYMYFVSGDEIIVVDPATLRIVAVLDV